MAQKVTFIGTLNRLSDEGQKRFYVGPIVKSYEYSDSKKGNMSELPNNSSNLLPVAALLPVYTRKILENLIFQFLVVHS